MSQVQKQMLNEKQAIDQGFSHDILFQLLSTAEVYALGRNANRKFKGYEFFNSSSKSRSKLKDQFLIQTDTFKNSYLFYCGDHGEYNFPNNLDKQTIINLMMYWQSLVEEKDKKIYDKTINLLKKDNINNAIKVGHKKQKNNEDLNDVQMGNLCNIMTKVSYSNEALAENIKKNLNENGKYIGNVILGADSPIDSTIAKIYGTGDISNPVKGREYSKKIDENEEYN